MRSTPVDGQLLLDLPDLAVTETSDPAANTEILRIGVGTFDSEAWPIEVSVTRRRHKREGRRIWLDFFPDETPGDLWGVGLTPDQARHAAAMLVAAARAAEEVTGDG